MKKFITSLAHVGLIIAKIIASMLCIVIATKIMYLGHMEDPVKVFMYFILGAVVYPFALIPWKGFYGWINFWIWLLDLKKSYYPEPELELFE